MTFSRPTGVAARPAALAGRTPFTALFALMSCSLVSSLAASAAPGTGVPTTRPNIIYILADDLGYGDLGCYGQQQIATPHLDRMAAEGIRFTQHFAGNTVCAPSRSSLLTGHHPGHARHRDNQRFVNSYGFRPEDVTFGEVMQSAGYATAICGKWHLGDRADSTDIPHYHGFDHAYCIGYPYPEGGREHWPSHVFVNGRQTTIPENTGGRKGRYMDDLYTDAAIAFARRERERPFLIFLSLQGVHAPIDPVLSRRYAGRDWPEVAQGFASMLEIVDANVGRLLAELKALGLDQKTIVLFSSDNGPHSEGGHDARFFRSSGELRGGKRDLYEGGVRVPLIARWPGAIRPGAESDHISANWDLLATFAELGGAKVTSAHDGISLVPALLGRPQPKHTYLYWECRERTGAQAVRWGDWKAVRRDVLRNASAPLELYDLRTDPGERVDVAAKNPTVVVRIQSMMTEAHVPVPGQPLFPEPRAAVSPAATQ
jgi:arylsulfatase A